jgi:hypothetical protein
VRIVIIQLCNFVCVIRTSKPGILETSVPRLDLSCCDYAMFCWELCTCKLEHFTLCILYADLLPIKLIQCKSSPVQQSNTSNIISPRNKAQTV